MNLCFNVFGGMGIGSQSSEENKPVRLPAMGSMLAGRYELGRLFGRGAMGVVYDAIDHKNGNDVALKILPPMALNAQTRERFLREIQLTTVIDHPNVIKTYDAGLLEETLPYIVVERLHGETLAARLLTTDVISTRHGLEILVDILPALHAVHTANVCHRDVKPANIFLDKRGAVLFDFGLSLDVSRHSRLTGKGVAVGTPGYMAPEQILDNKVDARTDIYGASASMYEALTGSRPVATREKVAYKVFEAILHEVPCSLSSLQSGITCGVDAMILRGLEKDPSDRFQTVMEMHAECERLLAELP